MNVALAALFTVLVAASASADDAFDMRLKALENELRCLVCQNQTLADSNAPLAEDLRREVRELATGGKSDDEIRAYLVARYGDFVLYKPPVKSTTYVLWFAPFLLLAGGAGAWWVLVRRRARVSANIESASPTDAAAAARALLDD
ncbi:MAG TPA: cytochrome c-type biogenesis protein [Casimicrobiaceae bacterium]|nr:cytochrome c-type biogenesis protein [Casimicrobiaceae bacterium]